jgi:hypothetical protein
LGPLPIGLDLRSRRGGAIRARGQVPVSFTEEAHCGRDDH